MKRRFQIIFKRRNKTVEASKLFFKYELYEFIY